LPSPVVVGCGQQQDRRTVISLSDPTITLTLVTVVLWLAVIGWKLQRKEKERARGAGRGAVRRAERRRDDYADSYDDRADRYDDRAEDLPPRRRDRPMRLVPNESRGPARDEPRGPVPSPPPRPKKAEVEINPGKCARFAFCEHEAPAIFKLVGDRIDYKTSVPADQIDAVAMAVKVCPARAIKMKVKGVKPYLPQPHVDDAERRPVRR
jgi:ferredoxin